MSLNALTIPATVGTTTVTIARPLQDDFAEQLAGNRELEAGSGCWGVDGSGQAYFDPDGSVDGEHAVLVANDRGELFLLPRGSGFRAEVRRPDGRRFPGHHQIGRPWMRSAANRDESGHLFPGHLPPRDRVIPPLERRKDGRVFGPTEPRVIGRVYDRRTDGRLLEPAGGRRPVRELPRGDHGRVFHPTGPRRPDRSYDRREDGTLLESVEARRSAREVPRGESGRVHPVTPPRRPARTYPPARERQPTTFTGRDRVR